jgi:GR25 family glycosyltransferase involved in LPS biosynthesis
MNIAVKVISRKNSNRRSLIEKHINDKNISFCFFDAADISNITFLSDRIFKFKDLTLELKTDSPVFDSFTRKKSLRIGEVGCFFSHYALWKALINSDVDAFLILEDDAFLMFDKPELDRFCKTPFPEEIDIILCQYVSPNFPLGKGKFKHLSDELSIKMQPHNLDWETTEGTTGYIITKRGAAALVKLVEEYQLFNPVDCFMTRAIARSDLTTYLCPKYLQIGMSNYWINTEIHYDKTDIKTILIDGITFKYE